MDELIKTFHIDWKLMIAQSINFGLVFLAIYMLAAKPLRKLIKDRTEEITTGLDNAEKAKGELASADVKKKEIIHEARNEAKVLADKAVVDGKDIIKEAKDKATLEKEEIIKQAKIDAEKEKRLANESLSKEAALLVADGVKKVVEGYVASGYGEDIIKAMLLAPRSLGEVGANKKSI